MHTLTLDVGGKAEPLVGSGGWMKVGSGWMIVGGGWAWHGRGGDVDPRLPLSWGSD